MCNMSGYNNHYRPEDRRSTQSNAGSQSFTGGPPTYPWTAPNQVDHGSRVIEEDMQEEPAQYQSPEPNMPYSHSGTFEAGHPLRSASEPNVGQLTTQYGGTLDPQLQAMIEARAAELFAQSQFYGSNPAGPSLRQNTAPVQQARQGHRYSGRLVASGHANVLVGNLVDGNHESVDTASHDYNFTETKVLQNSRMIMGNTTTTLWCPPNQGQPRYADGIYTHPGVPPQPMPTQGPYQHNMYRGR